MDQLRRNTLDDHFDNTLLPLAHQLKCLLSLLKLEPVGDESFDVDFPTGDQVHRGGIATNRIADRASNVQVTDARRGNGENHILASMSADNSKVRFTCH